MTADQNGDGADRASLQQEENAMSKLGQVVESVEKYNKFVLDQVKRARTDRKIRARSAWPLERYKSENPGYAHTDRFVAAAPRVT